MSIVYNSPAVIRKLLFSILIFLSLPALAQERAALPENPLAQLKDEVKRALADAAVPFGDEQEKAIILMMEDRRKASEDLFGDLMDFSAGPTRGEDSDRLRSAIEWMRNEFLSRLQDYLTPEQLSAWHRHQERAEAIAVAPVMAETGSPKRDNNQTQYVRINNNAFTSEDGGYRFGNRGGGSTQAPTEVIQRGGSGAYHGNTEFLFKDDGLNAGRRFAHNKPPYQERQLTTNIGGPVIPGRLSTNFAFRHNEAKDSDTIHATLPDSIFALGITRPAATNALDSRNTFQLSNANSLSFNIGYQTNTSRNQGIGGFVLPERAWDAHSNTWSFETRQFSALSARTLYETKFIWTGSRDETMPATEGLRINVLDAFNIGGAQNRTKNVDRSYEVSNLYTRFGEKLTIKTGSDMIYRKRRSVSDSNFTGTFTFSSLESYLQGRPINFRINRGEPENRINQFEGSFFMQHDVKLTPRFTFMYGARYEVQTNISDHNNFDPRVGFAWGIGRATVIRGGFGTFHQRLLMNILSDEQRFSGGQYEIIIDNPSYPDPFQGGVARLPSIWTKDPRLVTPYSTVMMLSYERTFLNTLFFSVAYDRNREVHRVRLRNINAPLDTTSAIPRSCYAGQSKQTCVRPHPDRGNILSLEPTAGASDSTLRLNFRGRFSIFVLSVAYNLRDNWLDNSPGPGFASGSNQAGYGQNGLNMDNYNLRADWSHGTTSPRTADVTLNARLPLGIFLTGVMSQTSHRRYTITTGKDDNQDTTTNDRPTGTGRNSMLAPGSLNFNFNISKAFFFEKASGKANGATRTNMNVFANMTNAFNHPNYGAPSGVMSSPNFGKITNAGDPREIEVGMRFQF